MQQFGVVEIGGIAIVIGYIGWLIVFFQLVRPRLMNRVGRRLGVEVQESLGAFDSGTYSAKGSAALRKTAGIVLVDGAMLMLGTVGMAAVVFIPAFLIAESGAPYRWESALTNTRMRMLELDVPPMRGGVSTARLRVVNEGADAQQQCRIDVAEYTARNGYLHGSSSYFDVAASSSRVVDVALEVLRPRPGRYDFHLALECRNRMKERVAATVDVVD